MQTRKSKKFYKEQLDAMRRLYGESRGCEETTKGTSVEAPRKPRKKVNTTPSEDDEQIRLVVWLKKNGILFFHSPNGGHRNKIEAMKLKRMGVQPGVPDVIIPMARGDYHGLAIELKRLKGGVLTDSQTYWLEQLRRESWRAEMCRGAEAAIKLVEEYMALVV